MENPYQKVERKRGLLGIIGLSACALCCLLPVIGAGAGLTGIVAFAGKLEKIALVLLGLTVVLYGTHFIRKYRSSGPCRADCSCDRENQKKTII